MSCATPRIPSIAVIQRICAVASLLGLFLQGSTVGHMLLVEHTRCAEHGTLIHAGADGHAQGAVAESDRSAFELSPATPSERAHEHCAHSADRRDAILAVLDAQICKRIDTVAKGFGSRNDLAVFEPRRFRLAPKNSPPA